MGGPGGGALPVAGGDDVLVQEALFFTGAAFLTFGGAYSVLSYVADVAVNHYGWLTADQMVQGLGLAESTPGPLSWSPSTWASSAPGTTRALLAPALRDPRCPGHHLRDVPAVLPFHLLPGALHRAPVQRPEAQGHPHRGHGGRGGGGRQPGGILRHSGSVPGWHLPGRPRRLRAWWWRPSPSWCCSATRCRST